MALIVTPGQLRQRAEFYRQLSQLTAAGLGVIKALELQKKDPPHYSYRRPIGQMLDLMARGSTFTDSLRAAGTWTPTFDIALIEAGEHSGRLDACFRLLADYYDDRALMARQMISDLGYPALLIHMAIFLFPFAKFFTSGDVLSYLLQTFGILIPLYAVVGFCIYAAQGRRGEVWRSNVERLLSPVPVLGKGRHYLALGRLAAALEALINAGVNIIEAWTLAAAASGSPALKREVASWRPALAAGQTPAELVQASSVFPETFTNLYTSGEISGKLDESLRGLHKYYQESGAHKIHLVAQWTPRFIYAIIALIIAIRVVSFWSGYFKQVQDAGGF